MSPDKKIRVMIVDDSVVARTMIMKGLSIHPKIEVVGYAINTMDAQNKYAKLNPDVMTMDVEMPGMNGIDFLKQFLPDHPVPVILVIDAEPKSVRCAVGWRRGFCPQAEPGGQDEFVKTLTQKVLIAATAEVRFRKPAERLLWRRRASRPRVFRLH